MQLESQKIAELRENKLRMESELDFVLNKLKSTEASLDESARTNSKLLDTLKALQDKLDSIEDEISLKSRDSQAAEEQHTAELSRVQNELDNVTLKLDTVTSEFNMFRTASEKFKCENAVLLQKLYAELEKKKRDLNEAIFAAAAIEKEKESLEVVLAQSERALKESIMRNEDSDAKIAGLTLALKEETTKLCEATAIRKQLEKHYLRQIEELLSNRPTHSAQVCPRIHS